MEQMDKKYNSSPYRETERNRARSSQACDQIDGGRTTCIGRVKMPLKAAGDSGTWQTLVL